MKRLWKVVRVVLVALLLVEAGVAIVLQNEKVQAADSVDMASYRDSRVPVDLTGSVMSLAEFDGDTTLRARLHEMARLDDVDLERSCPAMTGMKYAFVGGIDTTSGHASELQKEAMLYNTWLLQQLVYCSSLAGGRTIILPEGTFFFVSGHALKENGLDWKEGNIEKHVIKLHNNVAIVGAGNDVSVQQTTLKPYSEEWEFEGIKGGLDMFFYNQVNIYAPPAYLTNVRFSDFTIDSAETEGKNYNTSGKGFMINLFQNGVWERVTVKNTDGTGFGVDCPIGNSYIANSRAIGNGKGVKGNPLNGGGSGFGIGTGYSDNESFVIRDSYAEGNGKYGFFYEHQNRFTPSVYVATSGNFRIENSTANANMWNYGGLRSYDVDYSGIKSYAGSYTQSNKAKTQVETLRHIYFSDESRNVKVSDVTIDGTIFTDVKKKEWYADAVEWLEAYGLVGDMVNAVREKDDTYNDKIGIQNHDNIATSRTFGVGQAAPRADIVAMIWRMMGWNGDTLSMANGNIDERLPKVETCFVDVMNYKPYAASVAWAADNAITNGTGGSCADNTATFSGANTVTRAQVVTLLWRLSGSPIVNDSELEDFRDVKDKSLYYYDAVRWAVSNNITNGVGENTFAPDRTCTREQVAAFLYRYWANFLCESGCPDAKRLLDVHHNE